MVCSVKWNQIKLPSGSESLVHCCCVSGEAVGLGSVVRQVQNWSEMGMWGAGLVLSMGCAGCGAAS